MNFEGLIDPNFDVLTPDGWKKYQEIKIGDKVFSRLEGEMVESVVKNVGSQDYDGDVIRIKKIKYMNCAFTPEFKMLMCISKTNRTKPNEEYYETLENIYIKPTYRKGYIPKTAIWNEGNKNDKIIIPGVYRQQLKNMDQDLEIDTMKFVTFLGLYLSEGSFATSPKTTNRIRIHQTTKYGKDIIRELLKDFHPDIKWHETEHDKGFATNDPRLYDYVKALGNKYNKYIPNEIKQLDREYLERLIMSFIIGDGRLLKSFNGGKNCVNLKENYHQIISDYLKLECGDYSRLSLFSVSPRMMNDFNECLIKCGWVATKKEIWQSERYIEGRKIKSKKPLHNLSILRSDSMTLDKRSTQKFKEYYKGKIYYLLNEVGNFIIRHNCNSFWVGN